MEVHEPPTSLGGVIGWVQSFFLRIALWIVAICLGVVMLINGTFFKTDEQNHQDALNSTKNNRYVPTQADCAAQLDYFKSDDLAILNWLDCSQYYPALAKKACESLDYIGEVPENFPTLCKTDN